MPSHWFEPTKQWLSHPLFLALIRIAFTAILSYILIPYLTGKWQVNEKELDIKFDLAREVSDIVISYQMRPLRYYDIDYNSTESVKTIMPKIVEGFTEETGSCNGMRQRLTLYFPGNDKLIDEWSNICASLSFYYIYRALMHNIISSDLVGY